MMNFRFKKIKLFLFITLLLPLSAFSQITLPKLISDGMVLQRNTDVKIWGWADPGETIAIDFKDSSYNTTTNENGRWEVTLSDLEAGGPYTMTLKASNTVTIRDIMVGDVWIASGQSNMELPMSRVRPMYEKEIANAQNNAIRYFDVPNTYNFDRPQRQLSSGSWEKTTPETVPNFSAVAYFFASKLNDKYGVPVGIINSSLGGSPAEAWISEGTLQQQFPEYYNEAQLYKDSALVNKIQVSDNARRQAWYRQLNNQDNGYDNPETPWYKADLNTSDWSTTDIPGFWANTELGSLDGVVWFRKEVDIPSEMAGKRVQLNLGRIVDADSVFVNGTFVGTTSYQYPPRWYKVPAGVLKEGTNTIAIRVINERGNGGFFPDKEYKVTDGEQTIDLKGEWKYKTGASMPPLESQTFIRWMPVGLHNAMIAPLLDYRMKGVIWYQGESNTYRPAEYERLFSTMIKDWRNKWNQGTFPFLYVQLANFMKASSQPSESNWARLRESQLKTLSIPKTGMAVTIDVGEWNDIHPLEKKPVGNRLALAARKIAYGEDIVYSGPIYKSMEIKNDRIILNFDHTGSGLMAKGGNELKRFAIAGPDSNFVWANAKVISDSKIAVWSDKVENPVAVRYAWADNPEGANLYNKEGLPASPFRTDNWPATE